MKFSVLISIYFKEKPSNLNECLKSLANQTIIPDEIVIVEDGDVNQGILEVIDNYRLILNIKSVKLKYNQGLAVALNEGIKHCKYDLIARMDSDDICNESRFEIQLESFRKNINLDVVGTNMQEFEFIPGDLNKYKIVPETHDEILNYSRYRNPMNHPSVMFKKSKVLTSGSYENIIYFEDYYLWIKMLKMGYIFHNIQAPLVYFRVGNEMIGRRQGFSYLKKEFNFYSKLKSENLISTSRYVFLISTRLPLRLLPKTILKFLYKNLFRE